MSQPFRIAIFASGSGTNAEKIVTYFKGHRSIGVAAILTNNPNAGVLDRAKRLNIPAKVITKEEYLSTDILDWLHKEKITHIVLAGFLWLIPAHLLKAFPDKMINIHPALLPKFGGKGMYGMKIHEMIRRLNETETGITIHLVNENYDEGRILSQYKCVVDRGDTPQQIADKVHQLEYTCYPRVIEEWILGKIG
jgi:phosphoribosylglycinamide formyltransferase 1